MGFINKDKAGLIFSVVVHGFVFLYGSHEIVEAAQYGLSRGTATVEIHLVSAAAEVPKNNSEISRYRKAVISSGDGSSAVAGNATTTLQGDGGAFSEAQPNYLKNPAPEYPARARNLGQQGVVMLSVEVNSDGEVKALSLKKSSGHVLLDESAMKSVRSWKFLPASSGGVQVESKVEVPVRFKIESTSI